MNALTQRLSALLQRDLSEKCSSAAYAIMIDGQIIAEDSMGRNPIRGGTYNVGSISKVYCAVAVMQLVERGLLELDRPVCEYLPRFWMPDERYKKITLRHCLSHSCGLPGTQWRWLAASRPRRDEDYYEEVYRFLAHSALHSEPGAFSVYCNDGFTLAEMVVAQVSGISYGEYCKQYITEPIDAHSSRQSSQRNHDYQHTFIVGMPPESIGPEGAGGIGTTMADLCKFGQLFLTENKVVSEQSKQEIDKPQGVTFLPADDWAQNYGLGWDSVDMPHQTYALGCGVLEKGGGTKEFSSRLIVIPQYNAVLAISATYDCGADVKAEILQLFAVAMLERDVNIWKNHQPVPQQDAENYQGLYLTGGRSLRVLIEGARVDILAEDMRGGSKKLYTNLLYQDGEIVWKPDYRFFFYQHEGKRYLMAKVQNRSFPLAIKADDCLCQPLPEAWKARIGKQYLIANVFAEDIIGNSELNAFRLLTSSGVPNLLIASFVNDSREGKQPYFEIPLTPYIDGKPSNQLACGAINLPWQAGRDLLNLYFEEKDGVETCECSGYRYRDTSSLESWQGQAFAPRGEENQLYYLDHKLTALPAIPEGRRLLLFNPEGSVVFDSLLDERFQPVEEGYISLI